MIYGIRRSTDPSDRTVELHRFSTEAAAIAWREKQGAGQYWRRTYVREVYELHGRLPTGSRLIALMDGGRVSSAAAKANWVMSKGRLVK